ncbi:MAG: RecQ family ATP-dependent DNA helicase [Prevotella sp.]|nr:RecQ family ATP-dependent DNA helicase [Prevotella sp.]
MTTAEQILKQYWGYDDFRGIQREIIESICAGNDTLGLMPTGGGKSITFQVPALMMEGVCIVITPLIALMKDQVQNLRSRGIQASAIYSGMSHSEIVTTLENCIFGGVKILYISPERLASEIFQVKLRRIRVSFITVDEAHCISQWGHDFRPSYLEIAQIRKLVSAQNFPPVGGTEGGSVPILALTATATPRVMQDIQDILTIDPERKFNVFKMSFERKNLAYIGRETADKYAELLHILNAVPGSAIVYVRSRSRTKEIADLLNASSPNTQHPSPIIATHYHAGLDHSVRDERQEQWQRGEVRVMVATNAFGMGIDKADVRLVIHIDFPSSLEAYFQEAGRAGRDGKKAYAVLLYNSSDERKLEKRITDTFPEKDYIIKVYENLASFYQMAVGDGLDVTKTFDLDKFCRNFRHFPTQAEAALRLLDRAGYIHYDDEPDNASRLKFLIGRNELYRLEETTRTEEAVITALLRNHGNLFTDYAYINLNRIAHDAQLTPDQTYHVLRELTQRRILHFIPQRAMPTVTYTQRREESEYLVIPKSIYEERRDLFTKRIRSVWLYASNNETCRSRQLLRYFDENRSHDCGQCDVCLSIARNRNSNSLDEAQKRILALLDDGEKHAVTELKQFQLPTATLHAALRDLVNEEMVVADGSYIRLA